MYKRNIPPLLEFMATNPPPHDTTSTRDSGSSTTSPARSAARSTRAPTPPGRRSSSRSVLPVWKIWRSHQNGWVYDPQGLAPCLTVGNHSGVEPKIIVYDNTIQ